MPVALGDLARRLGLDPHSDYLTVALTHSSHAAEHGGTSNERFEFLGDAVVDLAVADQLVRDHPDLDEGQASLVRSRTVSEAALAAAATRLELGALLRVGRGERKTGGPARPSLLADAFEAVVAALYLERGYEAARAFVREALEPELERALATRDRVDPKSRLRQWTETTGRGVPVYEVTATGVSHDPTYHASVRVAGHVLGRGRGTSKKAAEAAAARSAWERRDDA